MKEEGKLIKRGEGMSAKVAPGTGHNDSQVSKDVLEDDDAASLHDEGRSRFTISGAVYRQKEISKHALFMAVFLLPSFALLVFTKHMLERWTFGDSSFDVIQNVTVASGAVTFCKSTDWIVKFKGWDFLLSAIIGWTMGQGVELYVAVCVSPSASQRLLQTILFGVLTWLISILIVWKVGGGMYWHPLWMVFLGYWLPTFFTLVLRRRRRFSRILQIGAVSGFVGLLRLSVGFISATYLMFAISLNNPVKEAVVTGLGYPLFEIVLRKLHLVTTGKLAIRNNDSSDKKELLVGVVSMILEICLQTPGFVVFFMLEDDVTFISSLCLAFLAELIGVWVAMDISLHGGKLNRLVPGSLSSSASTTKLVPTHHFAILLHHEMLGEKLAILLGASIRFTLAPATVALLVRVSAAFLIENIVDAIKEYAAFSFGVHEYWSVELKFRRTKALVSTLTGCMAAFLVFLGNGFQCYVQHWFF